MKHQCSFPSPTPNLMQSTTQQNSNLVFSEVGKQTDGISEIEKRIKKKSMDDFQMDSQCRDYGSGNNLLAEFANAWKSECNLGVLAINRITRIINQYFELEPELTKKKREVDILAQYNRKLIEVLQQFETQESKLLAKLKASEELSVKCMGQICAIKGIEFRKPHLKPEVSIFDKFSLSDLRCQPSQHQLLSLDSCQHQIKEIFRRYLLSTEDCSSWKKEVQNEMAANQLCENGASSAARRQELEQLITKIQYFQQNAGVADEEGMFNLYERKREILQGLNLGSRDVSKGTLYKEEDSYVQNIVNIYSNIQATNQSYIKRILAEEKSLRKSFLRERMKQQQSFIRLCEQMENENIDLKDQIKTCKKKNSELEDELHQALAKLDIKSMKSKINRSGADESGIGSQEGDGKHSRKFLKTLENEVRQLKKYKEAAEKTAERIQTSKNKALQLLSHSQISLSPNPIEENQLIDALAHKLISVNTENLDLLQLTATVRQSERNGQAEGDVQAEGVRQNDGDGPLQEKNNVSQVDSHLRLSIQSIKQDQQSIQVHSRKIQQELAAQKIKELQEQIERIEVVNKRLEAANNELQSANRELQLTSREGQLASGEGQLTSGQLQLTSREEQLQLTSREGQLASDEGQLTSGELQLISREGELQLTSREGQSVTKQFSSADQSKPGFTRKNSDTPQQYQNESQITINRLARQGSLQSKPASEDQRETENIFKDRSISFSRNVIGIVDKYRKCESEEEEGVFKQIVAELTDQIEAYRTGFGISQQTPRFSKGRLISQISQSSQGVRSHADQQETPAKGRGFDLNEQGLQGIKQRQFTLESNDQQATAKLQPEQSVQSQAPRKLEQSQSHKQSHSQSHSQSRKQSQKYENIESESSQNHGNRKLTIMIPAELGEEKSMSDHHREASSSSSSCSGFDRVSQELEVIIKNSKQEEISRNIGMLQDQEESFYLTNNGEEKKERNLSSPKDYLKVNWGSSAPSNNKACSRIQEGRSRAGFEQDMSLTYSREGSYRCQKGNDQHEDSKDYAKSGVYDQEYLQKIYNQLRQHNNDPRTIDFVELYRRYKQAVTCLLDEQRRNLRSERRYQVFTEKLVQEKTVSEESSCERQIYYLTKLVAEQQQVIEEQDRHFENKVSHQIEESRKGIQYQLEILRRSNEDIRKVKKVY